MESLQTAAEQFVLGQLPSSTARHYATAGRPDAHLQIEECSRPLETFAAHHGPIGARTTVVVKCVGDTPWTLYVPVAVEVEVPVLVLKRALARRSRVEPLDVEVQVRRLPGTQLNFINDPAALQGHRLKRPLAAGAAVTVDALTPEVLVRRGQQVTLLASSSAVEIRAYASRGIVARDRACSETLSTPLPSASAERQLTRDRRQCRGVCASPV